MPSKYHTCVHAASVVALLQLFSGLTARLAVARRDKLFCRITGRLVTMKEEAVVQHSSGKRFQICFGASTPLLVVVMPWH